MSFKFKSLDSRQFLPVNGKNKKKGLNKNPETSMNDRKILYTEFHKLKFFQNLIKNNLKNTVYEILSKMKFENFEESHILFYQNDPSKKFYIILKGKVLVLIKNKRNSRKGKYRHKFLKKHLKNHRIFDQKKEGYFLHQIVNEIKEGEGFGELGIIQNTNRLATIITASKCLLGSISSEMFRKILSNTILTTFFKKN